MMDSTRCFSSRIENYSKYRPGYPTEVLDLLKEKCRLTSASVVADIGSGTGMLTELVLRNGNKVFAVEPIPEMRGAAERLRGKFSEYQRDGKSPLNTKPPFVTANCRPENFSVTAWNCS